MRLVLRSVELMAEGGSFRDGWRGLVHGVKRMWKAFHDDQRLSWIGHYLICATATYTLGPLIRLAPLVVGHAAWGSRPHVVVALLAFVYFLWRETADERWHRDVAKDWDKLDDDRNLQGRVRRMVTPRADKIGDLTGPMFNASTTMLAHLTFGG